MFRAIFSAVSSTTKFKKFPETPKIEQLEQFLKRVELALHINVSLQISIPTTGSVMIGHNIVHALHLPMPPFYPSLAPVAQHIAFSHLFVIIIPLLFSNSMTPNFHYPMYN